MAEKMKLPAGIPEDEREEYENVVTLADAARKRVKAEAAAKGKAAEAKKKAAAKKKKKVAAKPAEEPAAIEPAATGPEEGVAAGEGEEESFDKMLAGLLDG